MPLPDERTGLATSGWRHKRGAQMDERNVSVTAGYQVPGSGQRVLTAQGFRAYRRFTTHTYAAAGQAPVAAAFDI